MPTTKRKSLNRSVFINFAATIANNPIIEKIVNHSCVMKFRIALNYKEINANHNKCYSYLSKKLIPSYNPLKTLLLLEILKVAQTSV